MHATFIISDGPSAETLNKSSGADSIPRYLFAASEDSSKLATACGIPHVYCVFGYVEKGRREDAVTEGKVGRDTT